MAVELVALVKHDCPVCDQVLPALDAAGVRVGKVQLSAALRLPPAARRELERFADPVYLHQVTQCNRDGTVTAWPDLPEALAADGDADGGEWRVHFHVPIFLAAYGRLESTQDHLRETVRLVRERHASSHLEIETYTWDVLPADLKVSPVESIAREYEWVLDVLG